MGAVTPVPPGVTTLDAVADQGQPVTGRNVWPRGWRVPHFEFRPQGITTTNEPQTTAAKVQLSPAPAPRGLSWCQTGAAERDYNVAAGATPARGVSHRLHQSRTHRAAKGPLE